MPIDDEAFEDDRADDLAVVGAVSAVLLGVNAVLSSCLDDYLNEPRRYQPFRASLPYRQFYFSLDQWSDETALYRTRFTIAEIRRMIPLLRLDEVEWTNRYRPTEEKALYITLSRIFCTARVGDIMHWYGCSRSQISCITNDVVLHLFRIFRDKLFWDPRRMIWEQFKT
ncbi:hypothetical protein PV11_03177 [Exophiala sideris]|uniref:Transposase Helix-turn-helix domain-containing protein n=1 Tax=Exophiala sideris TaxID=1016849 RepID=A0A0D1WFU8_9EURO|nr:hypothetical protein PV11_03177 [Exophiala sideris]